MLPCLENVKFLHPVGTSTFRYGVTIPVEAQTERMRAIDKGGKVPVTILFDTEDSIVAEIRRLNNKPGHLQFRYENKAQERLRQYLLKVFGNSSEGSLLEVAEVAPFTFLFRPIPRTTSPSLQISDMLMHRLEQVEVERIGEIAQIRESLASVEYGAGYSQSEYNRRINEGLTNQGWKLSRSWDLSAISRRTASGSRWSSETPAPITRTM